MSRNVWVLVKRSSTVLIYSETENFFKMFPSPKKHTSRYLNIWLTAFASLLREYSTNEL